MTTPLNSSGSVSLLQRGNAPLLGSANQVKSAKADDAESKRLGEAARQFEAVFVRQMLSSLEKATSTQGGKDAGSNLYGSMLADAVADAVSRAGGMGLASMLKHSLQPQLTHHTAVQAPTSSLSSDAAAADTTATIAAEIPRGGGRT